MLSNSITSLSALFLNIPSKSLYKISFFFILSCKFSFYAWMQETHYRTKKSQVIFSMLFSMEKSMLFFNIKVLPKQHYYEGNWNRI